MLTQHLGYGRFQLQDFCPGDVVARHDGSLAMICDPQPSPPRTDRIQICVDHGTNNARKEWLHKTALAYAVSEAQAWAIERRRRDDKKMQS